MTGTSATEGAPATAVLAPGPAPAGEPVLEARDLTKRYGARVALNAVSLDARPGELVAVIGPNGAGKTTLLSILAGEIGADAGTISRLPREVGWVPQQPALYGRLTVAENLRFFARLERTADVEAAVSRMLAQADLEERANDRVETLSGGNRQRVNVAIGLLSDPDVLLLDEPSTALDPRQRERLWEFLGGRVNDGTAIVYSTHNVQEAERHADRLLVLADGELVYAGSPRDLEGEVGETGLGFEAAFVEFLRRRGH
jgi:ABC-2 type transport system ATP-binding protein